MNKRVLITGSRIWNDPQMMGEALSGVYEPGAVLIEGGAAGADTMAATIWKHLGGVIETHSADWVGLGRGAGFIRNQEMVDSGADICLAFIRAESSGATHCAHAAELAGIPTVRYTS